MVCALLDAGFETAPSHTWTWTPSTDVLPRPARPSRALGAAIVDGGVDFRVLAPHATSVELCVFDDSSPRARERRFQLNREAGGTWSGHLDAAGAGTIYGYRVDGPWDPDHQRVFNPYQLLLDPYGRGLSGDVTLTASLYAHEVDTNLEPVVPLTRSSRDSAAHTARSVVVESRFPVADNPRTPWNSTVIYELHVKGFTQLMEGVPEHLRGTYAGLAHPTAISHLKALGVTAVELLPIHAKMTEPFLTSRGLTNYWGYSTLSYFAPEPSLATASARAAGAQAVLDEVRGMVSILHEHGIEVLLDVVFNHTCEGGSTGPSLSWRGFGTDLYYRHTATEPHHMIDDTGCGNTMNFDEARVVEMTLDSLRYWCREVGIDGFRYDLATTLGRHATGFSPRHPFFVALAADPVLREAKHIAEPWDIGPGGWQTGNFPLPWSEWNDRYRDTVRAFWLADFAQLAAGLPSHGPNDLATRVSGSADLFGETLGHARPVRSSVNFVTAHDGFTLADLTTYNHKHNEANLEDNRDGTTQNLSWNHGVEGHRRERNVAPNPGTQDSGMLDSLFYARERSMRNIIATLLVSAGTPMIVAGDEFGRTQGGNNNAYCQDTPVSWVDWNLQAWQHDLFDTTRYLLSLRHAHPVLRPVSFATGGIADGDTIADLSWSNAEGEALQPGDWHDARFRTLQMLRSGQGRDSDLLVVFNATLGPAAVRLAPGRGDNYRLVFDSTWRSPNEGGAVANPSDHRHCDLVRPGSIVDVEPQTIQLYLTETPH